MSMTKQYFEKASLLLGRCGLLFLRVNASNTVPYFDYHTIEKGDAGGFTVHYNAGPKEGQDIHFFSRAKLAGILAKTEMVVLHGSKNVTIPRRSPRSGSWSQWEVVAKKR